MLPKYDVFVSFRGKDIRHGFLSLLIDAFQMKKIDAFVDDKLERGSEMWSSLVGAIERSFISLIIFSQDYASSRWCLEELVTILECRKKHGQIVIPVFYHVEPRDVRQQSGKYQTAFSEHTRKYKTKVQAWRDALNESANLSGIDSSKFQNEAELLKEIVNLVLTRLGTHVVNLKGLVGIDEKIADIESLICKRREPKNIRLIGIWGMGGIGKTTLAEEVFNKLRFDHEYDGCCFLANEREQSSRHGIIFVKEKIFSELLRSVVKINTPNSLPNEIVWRIGRMKVLIVLDDVNDSDHLEKLIGSIDNFGSGSRIIVTTRDEQVLSANKADDIYQLRVFSSNKALELFNLNAFNQSEHQREYDELTKRVVDYAKGIPLILKVLAHLLCGKNKEVWESELDKLKKMPLTKVYDVLKLSYDDLDSKQQQIFLDLACFFLRSSVQVDVDYLKSLLKDDESDNSVVADLEKLKGKALITFSQDNFVSMHDSLQEMACEIVRRESIKVLGSHSRLWDPDDIYEALKSDKGTEAIRSIQIQLSTIQKQKLSPHVFAKMSKLRFLEIYVEDYYDGLNQHNILAEGLQYLATELRILYWKCYHLKSFPENFSGEKLVILRLPNSKIEKLWHGVKNLVNLKELDLSDSKVLKELPDLSKAKNLKVLILSSCFMLTSVHSSIFSLGKLEILDLYDCRSLTKLTSDFPLCSLTYLELHDCNNLREFSLVSANMKELRVGYTKLKALPSSFGLQSKLKFLLLEGSEIEKLPASIKNLAQLEIININFCSSLHTLPELPQFLKALHAYSCKLLQTLPELPQFLETLEVPYCTLLQSLPELPLFLKTLDVKECKSLQTLPELPPFLKHLYVGNLESLQTLPELPPFLETLSAESCISLQTLADLPLFLKILNVRGCYSLQTLPKLPFSLETLNAQSCKSLQNLPELPPFLENLNTQSCPLFKTIPNLPQFLKNIAFKECKSFQTLPELPPSLQTLNVQSCTSLHTLPKLPTCLETLNVESFTSLQSLPEFPASLKTLNMESCTSLRTLPMLIPPVFETLNVRYCTSLKNLPELPPSLKILNVEACTSLEALPLLPPSLITLNVESCTSLKALPLLPPSLKTIYAKSCSLQTLPTLPSSLETLNARSCIFLKTLPELAPPLKTLDVGYCTSLQNLPQLPSFLETLNVRECNSLQTLPDLPLSLKTLDAECCTSLQTLPELPPFLKTLNVQECKSLQTLQELPLFLKTLQVHECESLRTIPKLPLFLTILNISGCQTLQTVKELPPFLKVLYAENCKSIQTLPELPPFLDTLIVQCCISFKTLPELPPFLEILNVQECESLQTLQKLPPTLETLNVKSCTSLLSLPELPLFLKTLNVNKCKSLQTLPRLPSSLETLNFKSCISFKTVPKIPPFIKTLNFQKCESLQTLPQLPLFLETLIVRSCFSLKTLQKLPQSLENLNVQSCTSLKILPMLPMLLKTLNIQKCKSLQSLPKLPIFLNTLNVQECESLQSLPEFPLFLETINVISCSSLHTLPELPLFLGALNVKICTSLQTLPKFPPFLKILNVNFCERLQTLPEFPPFLETFHAKDCISLKTVLMSSSTAIEELKENRKQVMFWNCFNLDEYSLVAIELNAQINVMKFANQHLFSANHDYVENYCYLNFDSYQAVYVYPGSSVPNWLEYKTTKDYIIIDISTAAPPSPMLGFIFCFILGEYDDTTLIRRRVSRLCVNIIVSDVEDESEKDTVEMYIDYWGRGLELDHVCVMYDQRCSSFLNSKAKNQTRFKIEVMLEAQFLFSGFYRAPLQHVLKGFGISLVSTSAYNNFIHQNMELSN